MAAGALSDELVVFAVGGAAGDRLAHWPEDGADAWPALAGRGRGPGLHGCQRLLPVAGAAADPDGHGLRRVDGHRRRGHLPGWRVLLWRSHLADALCRGAAHHRGGCHAQAGPLSTACEPTSHNDDEDHWPTTRSTCSSCWVAAGRLTLERQTLGHTAVGAQGGQGVEDELAHQWMARLAGRALEELDRRGVVTHAN